MLAGGGSLVQDLPALTKHLAAAPHNIPVSISVSRSFPCDSPFSA